MRFHIADTCLCLVGIINELQGPVPFLTIILRWINGKHHGDALHKRRMMVHSDLLGVATIRIKSPVIASQERGS